MNRLIKNQQIAAIFMGLAMIILYIKGLDFRFLFRLF